MKKQSAGLARSDAKKAKKAQASLTQFFAINDNVSNQRNGNDTSTDNSGAGSSRKCQNTQLAAGPRGSSVDSGSRGGDSTLKLSSTATVFSPTASSYKIYCDLDGVLCDFDEGVKRLFNGKGPNDLSSASLMWAGISRAASFYANLPWTRDGQALWEAIKPFNPDILTGVSMENASREEKATWCRRELGVEVNHVDMAGKKQRHSIVKGRKKEGVVNLITCWSRNKHFESGNKAVLIDDRIALAESWERRGGIFIHHINAGQTLELLNKLGIIGDSSE